MLVLTFSLRPMDDHHPADVERYVHRLLLARSLRCRFSVVKSILMGDDNGPTPAAREQCRLVFSPYLVDFPYVYNVKN